MLISGIVGGLFSLLQAFTSINMKANQTISGTALNLFAPAFGIFVAKAMFDGVKSVPFTNEYLIKKYLDYLIFQLLVKCFLQIFIYQSL